MVKASFFGPMGAATLVNSITIRSVAKGFTHGQTNDHTEAPGLTIKWMALVSFHGQMAVNI